MGIIFKYDSIKVYKKNIFEHSQSGQIPRVPINRNFNIQNNNPKSKSYYW